ncbi:hypothetical protein ACFL0H_13160 [Thermodesulfobacteriota bacterium]
MQRDVVDNVEYLNAAENQRPSSETGFSPGRLEIACNRKVNALNEYMITRVIKADKNGLFIYTVPKAGWWGFAALNSSDIKIKHKGVEKDVELGAKLWVEFQEWKDK